MILSTYPPREAEVNYQHAARQAYIGLGTALIAAAEESIDCTPMEGFDPEKVDEILGLKERGLRSVILLPLGLSCRRRRLVKRSEKSSSFKR